MIFKKQSERIQAFHALFAERANSMEVCQYFSQKYLKSFLRQLLVFLIITVVVFYLCFVNNDLFQLQFFPGNTSKYKVVAEIPFQYTSTVQTQHLKEQRRKLAAPVFKINQSIYIHFEKIIHELDEHLDTFHLTQNTDKADNFELKRFVQQFNASHMTQFGWDDLRLLLHTTTPFERTSLLLKGLKVVQDLMSYGVIDSDEDIFNSPSADDDIISDFEIEGMAHRLRTRTRKEAMQYLRIKLMSHSKHPDIAQALNRILRTGIQHNVEYDESATNLKIIRLDQTTQDVTVQHFAGDVLIERGSIITISDCECLNEYNHALAINHREHNFTHIAPLYKLFLISVVILCLGLITVKVCKPSKQECQLLIALLILSLALSRLLLKWTCYHLPIHPSVLISSLPFCLPIQLVSILGTLLINIPIGLMLGIVTLLFMAIILSIPTDFILLYSLSLTCTTLFMRRVNSRIQIFKACGIGASILLFLGIFIKCNLSIVSVPMHIAIITYTTIIYAIIALILLPLLEGIFNCTSNFSYIELSDPNHTLLSKLRTLAPGTYQHSLMVSNLAEKAAAAINCNPYLARAMALYHDIGKITKPQFFTENQTIYNPHDQLSPGVSAAILRGHVTDGISLAKSLRLPEKIKMAIQQHHGTTLMQSLYAKAKSLNIDDIDMALFRYDGPIPQLKETLIVSIADSLEAACRSLLHPSSSAVQAMIDKIIAGKQSDGQFDGCNMSYKELAIVKESFFFTLNNMLHNRMSYDTFIK